MNNVNYIDIVAQDILDTIKKHSVANGSDTRPLNTEEICDALERAEELHLAQYTSVNLAPAKKLIPDAQSNIDAILDGTTKVKANTMYGMIANGEEGFNG